MLWGEALAMILKEFETVYLPENVTARVVVGEHVLSLKVALCSSQLRDGLT